TITYTVTATVSPNAAGAIANTASITAPAGVADSNPINNVAIDVDTVATPPLVQTDLTITKNDGVSSVTQGGAVTYVIVVTNSGASGANQATVIDVFPPTLTGVTYTATGTGGASGFTTSGSNNINDTVALPAGATITYVVNATVSPTATGTISNTATITPSPVVIDVNPLNNTATDIDTVANTPVNSDLSITKTDGVASVSPGGPVTYSIVVANNGPNAVAGATVADVFPPTLTNANSPPR